MEMAGEHKQKRFRFNYYQDVKSNQRHAKKKLPKAKAEKNSLKRPHVNAGPSELSLDAILSVICMSDYRLEMNNLFRAM